MKNILITGAAGFIGFHLSKKLVSENYNVIGIDNINDYYDPNLKLARLNELNIETSNIVYNQEIQGDITFIKLDLKDLDALKKLGVKFVDFPKSDILKGTAVRKKIISQLEGKLFSTEAINKVGK